MLQRFAKAGRKSVIAWREWRRCGRCARDERRDRPATSNRLTTRKAAGPLARLPCRVAVWLGCSVLAVAVGCAPPASRTAGAAGAANGARAGASGDGPSACATPWQLGVVGGSAQVVVMCPSDVRRAALDPAGPMAPALAPGLDPARDRVCGCASRMPPPPFVDLVFTAKPVEGRVTVEAKDDDELDPALGPAFVQCVGTVTAKFAPAHGGGCEGGGAATYVYPVRLELAP
jgi:hypothetical protein